MNELTGDLGNFFLKEIRITITGAQVQKINFLDLFEVVCLKEFL